jgi:hypothetical protein
MVTTALRALREEGLVYYEPYEFASLTERGTKSARSVLRRHKILRNFFSSVLLCAIIIGSYSQAAFSADMTVRVVVYNDTESKPLRPRAEIGARGPGSWWLARDTMQDISGRTPGKVDQLAIYPDGRDGNEITVQFQLTPDMCSQGCPRGVL